eukprot:PhM_4_TR1511/c0_g1_i1/m.102987
MQNGDTDVLMMFSDLDSVYSIELTKQWFAQGCHNGLLLLRDHEQGSILHNIAAHSGYIRGLSTVCRDESITRYAAPAEGDDATASPPVIEDGLLVSASQDGTLKVWDISTAKCLHTLSGHECCVECVAGAPRGPHVVSGSVDGCVALWHAGEGTLKRKFRTHVGRILGLSPFDDGRVVATASDDGMVKVVDLEHGKITSHFNLQVPQHCLTSADGVLYSGGGDGRVYTLDPRVSQPHGQLTGGHKDVVVGVSTHGTRVFSGGDDGIVCQWEMRSGALEHTYRGHSRAVSALRVSREGHLFTGSFDGTLRMWDNIGVTHRIEQRALAQEPVVKPKKPAKKKEAKKDVKKRR